ncbi:flippase [Caldithrix abyssi]|uniref:Membrane protein involved in the export of O-antigen and teichoic acid n=1 Tax=Caldithrix abyssi DSM 13497 TaxID=880073 RepID=H1XRC4_CALAY|nr:flippase [Caldithrix abyssi]APF18394.1 Membrane protein involved in the export of O-antigen and teichoic acid [Caldithrix abyssi DSM 13497]EHO42405.1 polysaccharide biosynthesis protein [Caldithrix abyssi DSM 13497]
MKSQFLRIGKNSIIYSFGNVSAKLVGFILLPIYTQYLTIADYGVLAILEITGQFLSSIFDLGLSFALNRWYWEEEFKNRQKTLFFTIFSTLVLVGSGLLILLLYFSDFLAVVLFSAGKYGLLIKLMSITVALNILSRSILNLMRIQERSTLYAVSNLARFTVNLVLTIYFVVNLEKGIAGIYLAQIVGFLVFFLFLTKYFLQNVRFKFERKVLKSMLAFGLPMVLTSIAGIILSITDRYSLKFLADLNDVGIYSFAFKISNSIKVFIGQSISWALTPVMYKMMSSKDNVRFYSKTLTYFTFILILFVFILSLYAKELIVLISRSEQYYPAYQIVPIISFAILFGLLRNITAIGINIKKKTKITALVITFVAILNIGLNILLVPSYKAMGASVATLISQILAFVLITRYSQKLYPVTYEFYKVAAIILISAGLITISFFWNEYSLLIRLTFKSVLLVLFPILLIGLKIVDVKNLSMFKENTKQ